MKIWKY